MSEAAEPTASVELLEADNEGVPAMFVIAAAIAAVVISTMIALALLNSITS